MSNTATVIAKSGLNVRATPNGKTIGALTYKTNVSLTGVNKTVSNHIWYEITSPKKGWVAGEYLQFAKTSGTAQTGSTNANKGKNEKPQVRHPSVSGSVLSGKSGIVTPNKSLQGYEIKNLVNVFGMPFHFLPEVDPSDFDDKYSWKYVGRTFLSEFIAYTPIAIFQPGTPDFLTSAKIGDKKTAVTLLSQDKVASGVDKLAIKSGVGDMLDYFTVKPALTAYYEYVNSYCNLTAKMMGIGNKTYYGRAIGNFDWQWFAQDPTSMGFFKKLVNGDKAIVFAYEPSGANSDSISNSTTESVLSSGSKSLSQQAREAEFIFGIGAGTKFEYAADDNVEQQVMDLTDLSKNDPQNVLKRIAGGLKTVSIGSNIKFPELYSDSNYSRQFSIDMKFKSPYADPYSKFLYVMVPFFHALCLSAPRSTSTTSYASPFLIRGYSKGAWSIDSGIVDNISWKSSNGGDEMSEDGIPTEIEVTMTFRDLYQALSILPFRLGEMQNFMANSGMLDLMGSLTGVDMTRFSLMDRATLYMSGAFSDVANSPARVGNQLLDKIRSVTEFFIGR